MSCPSKAYVGNPAPLFSADAVVNCEFKTVSLSDYEGKWVVLFLYPLDFTFEYPTEIMAFSDRADEFKKQNTVLLAALTDSKCSHLEWICKPRAQGGLGEMNIPVLADTNRKISRDYGVLKDDEGIAYRGLFIIDPRGVLRQMTIYDLPVGRSVDETLRLIQAFQFVEKHGEVCPANCLWKPNADTVKPSLQQSKEYFEKALSEDGETAQVIESFDQMGLKELLLRGIYTHGVEKPSPIQARAIKPCCEGRDVICQAQWGTGKTLTFCVAVLQRIDEKLNAVQALVLVPTRILANHTVEIMQQLSQFMCVKVIPLIGGTNVRDDERKLIEEGIHVVVGTPGRVMHMLDSGLLKTDKVKIFVVDEADEMLKEVFLESVHRIFQSFPRDVQVVFVSATMPNDMLEVTGKIMMNPAKILVKAEQHTLEAIVQFYIHLEAEDWKFDTLCDIFDSVSISKTVIFCSSKKRAEELKSKMAAEKFNVSCIHSDMTQVDRDKTIREFRSGSSHVLISTDVFSRGIDVQQVSVVINYDLPDKESYIRRISRSGRYGRKGCVINFVVGEDMEKMKEMEQFYSTKIKEMPKDIRKYLQND